LEADLLPPSLYCLFINLDGNGIRVYGHDGKPLAVYRVLLFNDTNLHSFRVFERRILKVGLKLGGKLQGY